jgi:hypothetical protein
MNSEMDRDEALAYIAGTLNPDSPRLVNIVQGSMHMILGLNYDGQGVTNLTPYFAKCCDDFMLVADGKWLVPKRDVSLGVYRTLNEIYDTTRHVSMQRLAL